MFLKKGLLYSVILLLIISASVGIFAGTTGKITGRVIDKQTKEGLPGVNVIIPELGIGAATDADGYYFILNVPVGSYSVMAQMITYAVVTMSDVNVSADISTTINFELVPEAYQMDSIVVEAQQAVIQTNVTQKERTLNSELLQENVGNSVLAAVATQAGVVGTGNAMHVRGGRTDEVGYMVDGMSIVDPVFKTLGATINKNAVMEVKFISGGFNAEYGEAMSGVVNVVTKEGSNRYEGQVRYEGNSFLPEGMNYGSNRLEMSVGGPIYKDKFKFFLSGDAYSTKDWAVQFIDEPQFFYTNDSTGYAFTTTLYDYFMDTLGNIDSTGTVMQWTQDSVPYFAYGVDTVINPNDASDTTYLSKIIVDEVLENRYGPTWWAENAGGITPHHNLHEYHGQLKFTVKPTNNIKWNFGGFLSHQSFQSFNNDRKYNLDNFLSRNTDGYQFNTTINWMLNQANFVTLTGSYFKTQTTIAPDFIDPVYEYNSDGTIDTFLPAEVAVPEWYEVWMPYGIMDTVTFGYLPSQDSRYKNGTPWGYNPSGSYSSGYSNYYGSATQRYSSYWAVKMDWTSQINKFNEMKFGGEYKSYELYQWDLYLPWDPNPFYDNYNVFPKQASAYVQDKMEFEGMVVNLGIRFDYLDSRTPYYVDQLDVSQPLYIPDTTISGTDTSITYVPNLRPDTLADTAYWNVAVSDAKYKVSPRLGISHPISETSVFHFNYGHFFQTPQMDYLFSGTQIDITKRGNSMIGSPNLSAERTIAYELGIATQVGADMTVDVTTYYKDIYGLVGSRKVFAIPQSYYQYQNIEYGNVKGFEVAFSKSSKYFSGNISYTLSFAKGTASDAWDGYRNSYGRTDPVTGGEYIMPKIPYYLSFDQRHTVNISHTLRMPAKELPIWADNWMLTFNHSIASGMPYTPQNSKGEMTGVENSERMPWKFNTDMKFSKGFAFGTFEPTIFVQVTNLFNIKNVEAVYPQTGLPNTDGSVARISESDFGTYTLGDPGYDVRRDLNGDGTVTPNEYYQVAVAATSDWLNDPTNYSSPREITVGIEFGF